MDFDNAEDLKKALLEKIKQLLVAMRSENSEALDAVFSEVQQFFIDASLDAKKLDDLDALELSDVLSDTLKAARSVVTLLTVCEGKDQGEG